MNKTSYTIAVRTTALVVFVLWASQVAFALEKNDFQVRFVGFVDNDNLFDGDYYQGLLPPDFKGSAYPVGAQSILSLNQSANSGSLLLMEPPKNRQDKVKQTEIPNLDPINIAFDANSAGAKSVGIERLFVWDVNAASLITVESTPRNVMDKTKIKRYNMFSFGVEPQGLTLNPFSRQLYALDAGQARILVIEPNSKLNQYVPSVPATIDLPKGLGELRGLAYNPEDHHLYTFNPSTQTLYKITLKGGLAGHFLFSDPKLGMPQAMMFAQSPDRTDPPGVNHLFVVTDKGAYGEMSEWAL